VRIWWSPHNSSKGLMEFNWKFKELIIYIYMCVCVCIYIYIRKNLSKIFCAPDDCIVTIRCPETIWSHRLAVQYEMERLSIKWPGRELNIGRWVLETWSDFQTGSVVQQHYYPMDTRSGVPRGEFRSSNPPQNFEGPPKSCHTKPELWKLLKIDEFRTPTQKYVRKKRH